ncbi:Uncharacterized protein C20orf195, partial [Chaetura pelagica]
SFGIMAGILNEFETSSEATACSQEQQDNASWEKYLERKNLVVQALHTDLSLHHLQDQQNKAELLKKCYFYLEVEPTHVSVIQENDLIFHTDIFQLIDNCRFQKVREVGKKQIEILLLLSAELLEQLERGREELICYIETCDMGTFLSQWDLIRQRMFKLSQYMKTLLSLKVPENLYVKHHLVSHADLGGLGLPNISLTLRTKKPLIFDRKESFACKDRAKLKWCTENPESHLEKYELHFQLLTGSQTEMGYRGFHVVSSDTCMVQNLQPGRTYKFTIRRPVSPTFVLEEWHDSIILKTK